MAGAGQAERAAAGVEHRVDRGRIHRGLPQKPEMPVDVIAAPRADRRARPGYVCSTARIIAITIADGRAVTRDVGHHDPEAIAAEREHVVVIAPGMAARFVIRRETDAADARASRPAESIAACARRRPARDRVGRGLSRSARSRCCRDRWAATRASTSSAWIGLVM